MKKAHGELRNCERCKGKGCRACHGHGIVAVISRRVVPSSAGSRIDGSRLES